MRAGGTYTSWLGHWESYSNSSYCLRDRQEENSHLNSETTIKAIQSRSPSGTLCTESERQGPPHRLCFYLSKPSETHRRGPHLRWNSPCPKIERKRKGGISRDRLLFYKW